MSCWLKGKSLFCTGNLEQVHEQLRTGTGQESEDASMCIGHEDVTKLSPQIPAPSESLICSPGSHQTTWGNESPNSREPDPHRLPPCCLGYLCFTVASENDTHVLVVLMLRHHRMSCWEFSWAASCTCCLHIHCVWPVATGASTLTLVSQVHASDNSCKDSSKCRFLVWHLQEPFWETVSPTS